ncbi:hypothetical protein Tco_0787168, partial [Tanacetum coccineum]
VLHKTALGAEAQENIAKVQEKLAEEEIEKLVEGDKDEESLEPGSHEENSETIDDDDVEIEKEKKDDTEIKKGKQAEKVEKEKNDDIVQKIDEVVKEKEVFNDEMGSNEIRKEKMQTLITSPTRSPRNVTSFDKIISKELNVADSPTTVTTSKASSKTKKQETISFIQVKDLTRKYCCHVVPDKIFAKTSEMIKTEMSPVINLAVNKDYEIEPINRTTLHLYLIASSSTAKTLFVDLQHQLYLKIKSKPQDQAANPEIWEILKAKFEKP